MAFLDECVPYMFGSDLFYAFKQHRLNKNFQNAKEFKDAVEDEDILEGLTVTQRKIANGMRTLWIAEE